MITKPSFNELYNRMWSQLSAKTGITNSSESGFASNIVTVCCQEFLSLWNTLETLEAQSNLSTATGEYLDKIGSFFGVSRLRPTLSTTLGSPSNVRFTNNGLVQVVIPSGTRVWSASDSSIAYQTMDDLSVAGGSEGYVNVIALRPGAVYNVGSGFVS